MALLTRNQGGPSIGRAKMEQASDVKIFEDLDAAAQDAGTALDRDSRPLLFERMDWFRLVDRYTPAKGRTLIIRSADPAGRAWLFLDSKDGAAEPLANWYSLRFGSIVERRNGSAPRLDALADGLRKAGISRLKLEPLAADDPLPDALRRKGWMVRRGKVTESWRTRTAGLSFDDYWAARPSRLRNTARRRSKSAGLEIRVHDRFDGDAWRDYETVYEASWKPSEGAPAMLRALAEQEGTAGTLRLGLAYLDGRPVASQLWLVENGTATIHKLAYAEDAKHCSPGTVLSVEMFRRALDVDRVEMIDFGIGGDSYKREWMSETEPLYGLTAFDLRSARGMVGAARAAAAKLVPALRSH
jgi:CelD/BcsL family acetyltransferase involved in cellulose biosynthesis